MRIDHRGPYLAVAKKCLNRPYIVVGLKKKMGGKTVAKGMRGDAFCEPCFLESAHWSCSPCLTQCHELDTILWD